MVVLWHDKEQKLIISASTDPEHLPRGRVVESAAVLRSWESRTAVAGAVPTDFDILQTPIAVSVGAKATMIVPITTVDHAWGIMQVFNHRKSLFPTDDINLLSLFAEQTAIALGYATLVTEQRNLIKQLSQRSNQLESAYKELESFSYSVSHDLRSPLRHISGYLEMLQKHINSLLDDKGRRYIAITLEEASRMSTLIDDLLAFSRFGRTRLHHTKVDFAQLVLEIAAVFEQEQQEYKIRWHINPLPCVRGDHSMLRLVWTNLISNALKFSRKQPHPEIEIGFHAGQDEYTFFVRDNGIGFNMEHAGQLFGVFQRLHAASEFEGTGIGLATVQRIIQRHGGRVWAEGVEGEGATFYFTLPVGETEAEEAAAIPTGARMIEKAGGITVDRSETDIID
jgi:signal transduction histidine kinase